MTFLFKLCLWYLGSHKGYFKTHTEVCLSKGILYLNKVGYDSPVSSKSHSEHLFSLESFWRVYDEQMAANADQEILDRREQILDEELDRFLEGINTSNKRVKTDTWIGL